MSPAGDGPDEGERYSFSYPADEADQPASAVIEALSWVKGIDATTLEPLADVVDPDALNALFGRRLDRRLLSRATNGQPPDDLQVVFEYAGYVVTVDADLITIRPQ